MYTQCPQCLTFFQVTPEHLRIAQGNVRCGQCRNVFSALGNLTEEPPEQNLDSEGELEEEIFIDEGELEDYATEYPEEFYIEEEVVEEEYEEEEQYYEEDYQQEHVQSSPPIDVEKTIVQPVFAQPQPAKPVKPAKQSKSPAKSGEKNSKLSEAIATIEKLKQSYSNLPFRRFEKEPSTKPQASNSADPVIKPRPGGKEAPSTKTIQRKDKQPPSSGKKKPVATPAAKKKKPSHHDIEIKHYTEDDGIDYDEALNALNDLKISDENNVLTEESVEEVVQTALQDKTTPQEDDILFLNDLDIADDDLIGSETDIFTDEIRPQKSRTNGSKADVKVKSLDRRAKEELQKKRKTKSAKSKNKEIIEPPKHLPAIPKQLIDDFHPDHTGTKSHFSGNLWALGSIVLMVLFLGQTVYFKHNDLARLQQLRPWIETFCGYISCEVNLPSDVRQLELVSQDIRSHPKVKSALLVTTTIINNARYSQSYPGLQITFSDLNGQRVAMRRFAPHEYLSQNIQQESGIPPNTPIQIELEMMDPGANAVNFEFDFIPLT